MGSRRITRRQFLIAGSVAGGSLALAACTGTSRTKTSGAASGGPSTGSAVPLGKVEGAQIVTDPLLFPTSFQEAPELAALVAKGDLPPVAERIGLDPLVLKAVHEVGRYQEGSVIRTGTIGSDQFGAERFAVGPGTLLLVDYLGKELVPNIARAFEKNADATEFVIHLRRGMRWSDGEPFTADDFLFWYEDMYKVEDIGFPGDLQINQHDIIMEKLDDDRIRFSSSVNAPLFDWTYLSAQEQAWNRYGEGGYAPKHYLQQFHPRYIGEDKANKKATDAGFKDWAQYFLTYLVDWELNQDLPVIMPWKIQRGRELNTGHFALERNPYSVWVDTDGNQLPYIGQIVYTDAGDVETLHLNLMSGEYDFQANFLDVNKLPLMLKNQQHGDYVVRLAPGEDIDMGVAVNLSYEDDPELGELFRTADFRRALSMGIDRAQLNEAFFLGLAQPMGYAPSPNDLYYPGDQWARKWASHDVDAANQLLDGLGLTMGDDGYRQRRDGSGPLRLTYSAANASSVDYVGAGEMLAQQWKDLGIDLTVEGLAGPLLTSRGAANKLQLTGRLVGGPNVFLNSSSAFPSDPSGIWGTPCGVLYAQWFISNGERGKKPYPELLELMELFRKGFAEPDTEKRITIGKEWWQMAADQCLQIGAVGQTLAHYGTYCARGNMGNVPSRYINGGALFPLFNCWPMSFYYTS